MDIMAAMMWQQVTVEEQVQYCLGFPSSPEKRVTECLAPLWAVTLQHFCSGTRVIFLFKIISFALCMVLRDGRYFFALRLEASFT
jgi:hypothetical protein